MYKLSERVLGYMRRHNLVRPGDRLSAAISGGADSVALLRLMLEIRDQLGVILSVVHLNHKLRGEESDADEQFVRRLAESNGLEITCESRNVSSFAAEKRISLEAGGRELRYDFFRRVLLSGINRIATAHTLNDQAETVLLKIARGAGTRGMAGIYPILYSREAAAGGSNDSSQNSKSSPRAAIVRPLLAIGRTELREYLAAIGQGWREDASNQDLRHARNRVRYKVLPLLERELNPGLADVLHETAEIARAEEEFWAGELERIMPGVWRPQAHGGVIDVSGMQVLPVAPQRRVLRAAAESLGLALEFRHVEEVLRLGIGDSAALPCGWVALRRGSEIELTRAMPQQETEYSYHLPIPGRVAVREAGVELEALVIQGSENEKYNPEHLVGHDFVQRGLVIRNWRAGERFWPGHCKEPRKIKELLQDKHITGETKMRWPVATSGGEVVWLRGFGVRRNFQANEGKGVLIREAGANHQHLSTQGAEFDES